MSAGQIYVRMLPDGEARPLTNDPRIKYNLAFSPDGSQIAYTVLQDPNFATYTVSVLGGDPHLLLKNAAGLTWLDPQHYLFPESVLACTSESLPNQSRETAFANYITRLTSGPWHITLSPRPTAKLPWWSK
jgi:hypothetical protein